MRRHFLVSAVGVSALCAGLLVPSAPAATAPGVAERASVDAAGAEIDGPSDLMGLSDDGRLVLFRTSFARDRSDEGLWLRDRMDGTTTRVSVTSHGERFGNPVTSAALSGNGSVIAFVAIAANGTTRKLWVHDRASGTTKRLGQGLTVDVSRSGRFVAFATRTAEVRDDTNNQVDVFVLDRRRGTTERVSLDSNGRQRARSSWSPSISADGRFVAYQSRTNRLVPGADRRVHQIYLYDRKQEHTEKISVRRSGGGLAREPSWNPVVSADGRMVLFSSRDGRLTKEDHNTRIDVFVRDVSAGRTRLVSEDADGGVGNASSCSGAMLVPEDCHAISADNRYVAFISAASDLVASDANGRTPDVFVRDLRRGTTRLVSAAADGGAGNQDTWNKVRISADARVVGFSSLADNLVLGDTNGQLDTFVRELSDPGSP